jgi:hypothetical protein
MRSLYHAKNYIILIIVIFCNYLPLSCQYNRDVPKLPQKKQHIVKISATILNKSKKKKPFLFLDLLGAVAKVRFIRLLRGAILVGCHRK